MSELLTPELLRRFGRPADDVIDIFRYHGYGRVVKNNVGDRVVHQIKPEGPGYDFCTTKIDANDVRLYYWDEAIIDELLRLDSTIPNEPLDMNWVVGDTHDPDRDPTQEPEYQRYWGPSDRKKRV